MSPPTSASQTGVALSVDTAFTDFVHACEAARTVDPEPASRIARLTAELARHWRMPDPRYLQPEAGAPYASYLLYLSADARFCIVLDTFLPGQAAVIHNHRCWCVFACLQGVEHERLYDVDPDLAAPPRENGRRSRMPGEVSVASAAPNGFHQVECASSEAAVSLHLYGADIGAITRQRWNTEAGLFEDFVGGYSNAVQGLPTYFKSLTTPTEAYR